MQEIDIEKAAIEIPAFYEGEGIEWVKNVRGVYKGLYAQYKEITDTEFPEEICGPITGGLAKILSHKFNIPHTADESVIPRVEIDCMMYLGDPRGAVLHRAVNVHLSENKILHFDPSFENQYGTSGVETYESEVFNSELEMANKLIDNKLITPPTAQVMHPGLRAQFNLYRNQARLQDNADLASITTPLYIKGTEIGGNWGCFTLSFLENILDSSEIEHAKLAHRKSIEGVNAAMRQDSAIKDRLIDMYKTGIPHGRFSIQYAVENYGLELDLEAS